MHANEVIRRSLSQQKKLASLRSRAQECPTPQDDVPVWVHYTDLHLCWQGYYPNQPTIKRGPHENAGQHVAHTARHSACNGRWEEAGWQAWARGDLGAWSIAVQQQQEAPKQIPGLAILPGASSKIENVLLNGYGHKIEPCCLGTKLAPLVCLRAASLRTST